MVISDLAEWKQFLSVSVRAEFGLKSNQEAFPTSPLADLHWLPSSIYEDDPVHGNKLAIRAEKENLTGEFKAARLSIFKQVQISLRPVPEIAILKTGSTDLGQVARGAALFAFRQAASEIVVSAPGFWCSVVALYHSGNWPLGRIASGEIIVL